MYQVLKGISGRIFDFDLTLTDEEGEPLVLEEGEKYFFAVGNPAGEGIDLTGESSHFRIERLPLSPGRYRFDAGIEYPDGTRLTVLTAEDSRLVVGKKANEDGK